MRKNRPGSAKRAIGQQEAAFRRGAPGRQFIGDSGAAQSDAAKRAERRKVERMAEVDAATRTAEELGTPVSAILAELDPGRDDARRAPSPSRRSGSPRRSCAVRATV